MFTKKKYFLMILFLIISYSLILSNIKPNILILHSYHKGYEWTDSIHKGIVENLNIDVNLYVEYMDTIRHNDNEYYDFLKMLYSHKYTNKNIKFDIIICSDDNSFNFLINNRENIFFNSPIIFVSVDDIDFEFFSEIPEIYGLYSTPLFEKNIELILSMGDIETERIVVISGARPTEKIFLSKIKEIEHKFFEEVDFLYLAELEKNELINELNKLSPTNKILNLSYLSTPSGDFFSVKESMEIITNSTNSLIFAIRDFIVENGAVGGYVIHGYTQGEEAAKYANKILQNNNFLGATITYKDLNKYMFNGKKLHEYQISERSLPNNSIIINRQSKYLIEEWDDFIADTFFGYDLFENHGGIMLLVEPNSGLIVDANKSAIDYYSYESLIGKNIMEINALSEQEIIKEMEFAKIYEKNYFNFKHILGNGEIRNVEVYSYPIEVKNTNILFSIIIDVTEKMNLQKQLEENLEEHKKAEKFAEFGHWSINLNTNIVDSSYGAKNLYGFDKENLTLKDIQELPLSKYRDELDNALYELINEGKAYDIKFEIQRKDGEILWIHSIAEYNEDENFIFGIIHNITDAMLSEKNLIKRTLIFFSILILLIIILIIIIFSLLLNIKKRKLLQSDLKNKNIELTLSKQKIETTNEELEATNEELETTSKELENNYSILEQANNELKIANEAKASFLARVSHELRTPMNGILGGSYLINNSDDITQIKEYAKLIEESSNRLMPIIDDILNVSKKEEVLINSNDKIDVKKFLEYEIMKFKSITEKKYLKFIFKNKIENNIFVKSDKTKITHILNRIIKNAITYTEKGKIEITCETQDIENNKLNLKIAVKDTGIGIKKEFYEKIFEPFEQGEEYLTRKHQGLGLGLSITKDLIEKMGGNINFKSEEAKGTTFYFNLILEKIIEPNKSVISNKTDNKIIGNKIKILAAEDDEIGIALLKNFFKKQSYDLDVAINGEKAVDLYKNKKYDIILMDIQMPILDGIETARIIRSIENKLKKHTPIIALTGHANETDKENCLNAGMDDFLIKPYEFEDLLYAINKYVLKE